MSSSSPLANPEALGARIITPLKDRFGAPSCAPITSPDLADEVTLIRQEATLVAEVGEIHPVEVPARLVRSLRESSSIDQRSGVSARFAIAAAEGVAASALRRAARNHDHETAVARTCDLAVGAAATLLGKIEFEMGEEGRERAVLELCSGSRQRRRSAHRLRSGPVGFHRGLRPGWPGRDR